MRKYELTIVLDGKTSSTKKNTMARTIEKLVAVSNGKNIRVEEWGIKDLAYRIRKSTSGLFLHFVVELESEGVKNLINKLKANDDIIRYLLVKKD